MREPAFVDVEELQSISIANQDLAFERARRFFMDEIIRYHTNCRCVLLDPEPEIPRNERFDAWLKRSAKVLDDCAKDRR